MRELTNIFHGLDTGNGERIEKMREVRGKNFSYKIHEKLVGG